MSCLPHIYPLFGIALSRPGLLALLILACAAVLLALPVAARRGMLHIPGYIGLAILAFIVALVFGRLAGAHKITGSPFGVFLSILFFLLISVSLGSLLALIFFRPPPES